MLTPGEANRHYMDNTDFYGRDEKVRRQSWSKWYERNRPGTQWRRSSIQIEPNIT